VNVGSTQCAPVAVAAGKTRCPSMRVGCGGVRVVVDEGGKAVRMAKAGSRFGVANVVREVGRERVCSAD